MGRFSVGASDAPDCVALGTVAGGALGSELPLFAPAPFGVETLVIACGAPSFAGALAVCVFGVGGGGAGACPTRSYARFNSTYPFE